MDKVCFNQELRLFIYLLFLFTQITTVIYVFIIVFIRSQETRLS